MSDDKKKDVYNEILEKFKILKADAKIDCTFDKTQMENNFNITSTICKWLNRLSDWKEIYRVYESKILNIKRTRFEFYKKEFHLSLNNQSEMELFIFSDVDYIRMNNIFTLVKEIIQYIKDIIDNLKGKGYEVNRYQNYLNFINGK